MTDKVQICEKQQIDFSEISSKTCMAARFLTEYHFFLPSSFPVYEMLTFSSWKYKPYFFLSIFVICDALLDFILSFSHIGYNLILLLCKKWSLFIKEIIMEFFVKFLSYVNRISFYKSDFPQNV